MELNFQIGIPELVIICTIALVYLCMDYWRR